MEIWVFMSPDMRVKQGKYVPNNPRHEFFIPQDGVFFFVNSSIWGGEAQNIFNLLYTKKVDVSAGKNLRLPLERER